MRRWPIIGGAVTAAAGVTLIVLAVLGLADPATAGLIVVAAALVELACGALLGDRRGTGMAHIIAGVMALFFAAFIWGVRLFDARVISAPAIAMALGLYCIVNALIRGMDVVVDKPAAALSETVDTIFTFVLGVVLWANWVHATPAFVGMACGIELLSGAVALIGSGLAWYRHPERPAYEGRADRLMQV